MNICFRSHFSDDVLERYAIGKASTRDCGSLEEHLLLCAHCETRLKRIEEFIGVMRAALEELEVPPHARFSAQSALAL